MCGEVVGRGYGWCLKVWGARGVFLPEGSGPPHPPAPLKDERLKTKDERLKTKDERRKTKD